MKPGQGGAKVYANAGALAHNTGRMFIGDPNGVTKIAMRRRAENMLSLALRYGTTDFIAPHPDQIKGDATEGVPPLRWVYGDDEGNAERLIAVNLKAVKNAFPAISKIDFDVATGQFLNADTRTPIDRDRLARRALKLRAGVPGGGDLGRAAAAGRTIARSVVLKALSRPESGSTQGRGQGRDGVLDRLGAATGGASASSLKGLFSRTADTQGPSLTVRDADGLIEHMRMDLPFVHVTIALENVDQAPQALQDKIRATVAENDIEGAHHDGKIYVFPSHFTSMDRMALVVMHHEVRHHGIRSPLTSPLLLHFKPRNTSPQSRAMKATPPASRMRSRKTACFARSLPVGPFTSTPKRRPSFSCPSTSGHPGQPNRTKRPPIRAAPEFMRSHHATAGCVRNAFRTSASAAASLRSSHRGSSCSRPKRSVSIGVPLRFQCGDFLRRAFPHTP